MQNKNYNESSICKNWPNWVHTLFRTTYFVVHVTQNFQILLLYWPKIQHNIYKKCPSIEQYNCNHISTSNLTHLHFGDEISSIFLIFSGQLLIGSAAVTAIITKKNFYGDLLRKKLWPFEKCNKSGQLSQVEFWPAKY